MYIYVKFYIMAIQDIKCTTGRERINSVMVSGGRRVEKVQDGFVSCLLPVGMDDCDDDDKFSMLFFLS